MNLSIWTTIGLFVLTALIIPAYKYVDNALKELQEKHTRHDEQIINVREDLKEQKATTLGLHELMLSLVKEVAACSAMLHVLVGIKKEPDANS